MQQVLKKGSTLSGKEGWICNVFTSLDDKGKHTNGVTHRKISIFLRGEKGLS